MKEIMTDDGTKVVVQEMADLLKPLFEEVPSSPVDENGCGSMGSDFAE